VAKALVVLIGIMVTLPCSAQESSSQQAPGPATNAQESDRWTDGAGQGSIDGAGTYLTDAQQSKHAGGLLDGFYGAGGKMGESGFFFGGYSTGSLLHPAFPGIVCELGLAGHTPSHVVDGVFAANMQPTFYLDKHPNDPRHKHSFLFLNGGYTRFFTTGNAADYGGGVIWRTKGSSSNFADTRFEYREYYIAGFGRQQEVRISREWGGGFD
jgi:hypothetical protein